MGSLTSTLVRSMGPALSGRAEGVAAWMEAAGLDVSSLEASVRGGRGAPVITTRMMIERVPPGLVSGFFAAIGAAPNERASALINAAEALGLFAIVGWSSSATHALIKVYANASDGSAETRRRLASSLDLPVSDAPHIVGLNFGSTGYELKAYAQSGHAPPFADELADRFAPFSACGAVSAWVTSSTVNETEVTPRAIFAGLKSGHPATASLLDALPGWSLPAIEARTPFPLGPIQSVGFDIADSKIWTVYFKPPSSAPASWSLEPVLVARDASSEIGLFIEPSSLGRRAFATAGAHALSYRVRAGVVGAAALEALMRWAQSRLESGVDPSELAQGAGPPAPWRLVGNDEV